MDYSYLVHSVYPIRTIIKKKLKVTQVFKHDFQNRFKKKTFYSLKFWLFYFEEIQENKIYHKDI